MLLTGLPDVSVIIPTRNRVDQLTACLASVLAQTHRSFEVIVVDDGSNDATQDLNVSAIDPRIIMVRHETTLGASQARNQGIDLARAPLVAFLDADDLWLEHKLERQLEVVATRSSRREFILTGECFVDGHGPRHVHNRRGPKPGEDLGEYLLAHGKTLQTSTIMLPTALARRVRFSVGLKRCQDCDFVLRLVRAGGDLIYLEEPLAVYQVGPDPERLSNRPGMMRSMLEWFYTADDLVTVENMQRAFSMSAAGRALVIDLAGVCLGFVWLARCRPSGIPMMVGLFLRHLIVTGSFWLKIRSAWSHVRAKWTGEGLRPLPQVLKP